MGANEFLKNLADQLFQTLLPDAAWNERFTPVQLNALLPTGTPRGIHPRLILLTHDAGAIKERRWSLGTHDYDDWETRRALVESLGVRAGRLKIQVLAVLFLSEAWSRIFTEEEAAARRGRLVASYDDKEEVAAVMGLTLDRRAHIALTPIRRAGREQRIVGYGEWDIAPDEALPSSPLLEQFYFGYLPHFGESILGKTSRDILHRMN